MIETYLSWCDVNVWFTLVMMIVSWISIFLFFAIASGMANAGANVTTVVFAILTLASVAGVFFFKVSFLIGLIINIIQFASGGA